MGNEPKLLTDLKERHTGGLQGILRIQNWKQIRKKLPFQCTVAFSIATAFAFYLSPKNYYEILSYLIQLGLSILPNLLGFSLGGYALIIGFGNSNLIKSMTRKLKNENGSLFQKLSAIFAFGLLLQVASLIASFVINIIINLDVSLLSGSQLAEPIYTAINFFLCFIVIFFYYWTLFVIPYMVTNIFSFGQTYHFYLSIEKISEENKKNDDNKDPEVMQD